MGVRFVTEEEFPDVLHKTIVILGPEGYDWYIDNMWVDGEDSGPFPLMEDKPHAWPAVLSAFGGLGNDIVQTARLRRYAPGDTALPMETLEDYETSKCSLVLLCVDAWEYEIYAKDEDEVKRLYDACAAAGFDELELQTDDNCGRTGMGVY